jgi:hypothetical protein
MSARSIRVFTGRTSVAGLLVLLCGCGATKTVGGDPSLDPDAGTGVDGGFTFDTGAGEGGPFDPDGGPSFQELALDPPNATIYIDTATAPATPATVTYKATIKVGGVPKDVSSSVALTLDDPALGTFSGPTFTSVRALPGTALGVTTVVHGNAEGKAGTAQLTIVQLRKTGDKRDFFFVEPYLGTPSPSRDVLKFGTNIKQVDVAISMDTTGSMGGSITNLKTNISSTLLPELVKAIPSVGMAIVYHDDYPVGGYGSASCGKALPGDLPVGVIQIITTDLKKAQDGANKLETHCGSDGPESQVPSMYHIITGNALTWTGGSVPKHTPAAGTFGGVDFRPGSLPVVVEITDVSWHDALKDPYTTGVTAPPSVATLKTEFTKVNARFVDITNGYTGSFSAPEDQANDLSDGTKSNIPSAAFGACPSAGTGPCCTGVSGAGRPADGPGGNCRLNFLHSSGSGVSTSIVKAIQAISVGSQFDVTAVASNDPTNADGVDATKFIKELRAMDEGDAAQGCPAHAAKDTNGDGIKDTFIAVVVGTNVCFEIIPEINSTVKPKSSAQFFNAFIDVLGMPGSVKLDKRTVLFLVPPKEITAF